MPIKRKPVAKKSSRTEAARIFARRMTAMMNARASYDGANTNRHNSNHWLNAGSTDADSALISELHTLRDRCRHEQRNNPYALALARKHANYVVGQGPTLQVEIDDEKLSDRIESDWASWCDICDFRGEQSFNEMLHLGVRDLYPSGEYFRTFNRERVARGVGLRLLCLEADRVSTPWQWAGQPQYRDGIEVDPNTGKKVKYWVSKWHPGNTSIASSAVSSNDFNTFAPSELIHFYIVDRPEQTRGTPLLAPVLEIFAKMRRWDEATIAAAERAALFGVIMVTNSDMMLGDNPSVLDPEEWEIEAGMGVVAPPGYDMKQIQPTHPGPQYEAFKKAKLTDYGAAVDMPYNVLANDSSGHNYASGRLDWQGLVRSVKVMRSWIERRDLGKVFSTWWSEYRNSSRDAQRLPATVPITWQWPGFEHVDPQKEADAAATRLENNLMTYAEYYAEHGDDWRAKFRQKAKEKAFAKEVGLHLGKEIPEPAEPEADMMDDTEIPEPQPEPEPVKQVASVVAVRESVPVVVFGSDELTAMAQAARAAGKDAYAIGGESAYDPLIGHIMLGDEATKADAECVLSFAPSAKTEWRKKDISATLPDGSTGTASAGRVADRIGRRIGALRQAFEVLT